MRSDYDVENGNPHAARYFLMNNKGAIAGGYVADLVILDSLEDFVINSVTSAEKSFVKKDAASKNVKPKISAELIRSARSSMRCAKVSPSDFKCGKKSVIGLIPGEIVTRDCGCADKTDAENDILKCAVTNGIIIPATSALVI